MTIIQCKLCDKPFQYFSSKFCHECLKKIDEDFIKVRDYIYDHSNVDIDVVAKETQVDKAIILHLLHEGRLILGNAALGGVSMLCRVCKKPISSGKMCNSCKMNLGTAMQKSIEASKPPQQVCDTPDVCRQNAAMHTRHR